MVSNQIAENCEEKAFIKRGTFLFVLCWIAYSMNYIGRYNYSACMSSMIADSVITHAHGGIKSAFFLLFYGGGQLANGILGDRVSPKYMIGTGLFLSGIANMAMSFAHGFAFSCIVWCVNGYACSMLWSPIIRLFAEFMLSKQSSRAILDIAAAIPAGSLMSFGVSALLLRFFTWRWVFVGCSLLRLAVAAVWFVGCSTSGMREYFSTIADVKARLGEGNCRRQSAERSKGSANGLGIMLATGVIFTFSAVVCNGLLKESVTQYVPKYLSDVYSVTGSTAAAFSMILPIVNVAGAYAAKGILVKVKNNELTAAAFLFAASVISSILLCTVGGCSIAVAAFLIAVTTSAMLGVNTLLLSFIPICYSRVGLSSSLTGLLDAIAYLASALASVVFGSISGAYGWGIVTVLWGIIGAIGITVCIVGVPTWKKAKDKLTNHAEDLVGRL